LKTLFFLAIFTIISSVGFFEVAFAQTSENQGGTITIDSGVEITLDDATFDNMGPFNNNGILTLTATTTFNNLSPHTFQNSGTTNNAGTVNNSGVFDNTGTFNNVGTFNLLCGGTVTGSGTFTGNPIVDMCETADTIGDFNGDGYSDSAIGVPGEDGSGAVHIIYGSAGGLHQWLGHTDQIWTQDTPGIEDSSDAGDLFGSLG